MPLLPSASPEGCGGGGAEGEGGRAGGWPRKGEGGFERRERQEGLVESVVRGLGGEGEKVSGREHREIEVAE